MPRKNFVSYSEAKAVAQREQLQTWEAYRAFAREHYELYIPINPERVYGEFEGWSEFLGMDVRVSKVMPASMRSFASARRLVREKGFQTVEAFTAWAATLDCPENIPRNPARSYADQGWKGWPDFLGTNPTTGSKKQFVSLRATRAWARERGIRNSANWRELVRTGVLPPDMPSHPDRTYGEQWPGWEAFLGGNYVARNKPNGYASYQDASTWAQRQRITNANQWRSRMSEGRPEHIPFHPDRVYLDEWEGWEAFLGQS